MTIENTDQSTAWNGAEGAAWASAAPERDAEDGPEAELCHRLLEAAGIGRRDRVLDIGCGAGATSRRAARRAPEGRVVGAAFANIGRALRPGGRLAFVCPQPPEDCAWYVVPVAALLGIDPRPHAVVTAYPGTPPAMFSLSDPLRIAQVLTEAGFTGVAVEPLHVPARFGDTVAEAAGAFLASGPTRYIVEQDDDLTWEEARARLVAALEPYAGAGGVLLPGAQWLVSAVRMAPDPPGSADVAEEGRRP
ncbi:hypothetical protein ACQEVF_37590 [Nonomuraea polychroma]|uniref:hypothetical protein n=1 Tax=Nonomuraea polychroma TaxID=46176 RepID=UPI003D8EB29E